MDCGAGIGVVDEESVGVLPLLIVVGEHRETEKKEGKEEESEAPCRCELLAVVDPLECGAE